VIALYQALYRKWRPRTFDQVVGQAHITETLKRQVASGRLSHAYLFTGTRGTGKTSCAKILARAVNCQHPVDGNPCNQCDACRGIENGSILDVLELDAASNNGVDQVRALRDEAIYSPAAVRKRVYIVDEVHMLSTAAFNALLKILEEPPEHLMFILATTELHKVPATIKSRCQQFAFKRILPGDIASRLSDVAQAEGIRLNHDGAELIARLADGGMRDALSLLDQCAGPDGPIGAQEVLDALGLAGNLETANLMGQIAGHDAAGALETLSRLYAAGKDVGSLLGELSALARDLLIRKTAPQGGASLLTGGYDESTMRRLSQRFSAPRLVQVLGALQAAQADLPRSANRRTDAELCLIKLSDESLDASAAGLSARIARLEERLADGEAVPSSAMPASAEVVIQPVRQPVAPPPPPAEKDLPPWEEPAQPAAAPPAPAKPEPPASTPAPAPVRAEPAASTPACAGSDTVRDFWPQLTASLRGKVPMGEYTFLSNPAMAQGVVEHGALTIWVQNDFVRSMLNKPAVLKPAASAASAMLGAAVHHASVAVGQPPAPTAQPVQAHDNLDDLLALSQQFDNIIVE